MKVKQVCAKCGSENVRRDAYVAWNLEAQQWEVVQVFDKGAVCEDCGGEAAISELPLIHAYTGYEIAPTVTHDDQVTAYENYEEAAAVAAIKGGQLQWSLYGRHLDGRAEFILDTASYEAVCSIYSSISACEAPFRPQRYRNLPKHP